MSSVLPLRYADYHPPGECFFQPLNFVLSSCNQIIAPLECANGCSFVAELVERVFLAVIVALFIVPSALIAGVIGIPFRSISQNFVSNPLIAAIPKTDAYVDKIPGDGNCAFTAFMTEAAKYGLELNWTLQKFREASAEWILMNWGTDSELEKRLVESIKEYAEVKKQWELLKESQTGEIDHQVFAEADLNEEMVSEYLDNIRLDTPETRVYASRAHYYAWSRMFDIPFNIIIYHERRYDYNPVDYTLTTLQNTIRFLHTNGNHIDLLLLIRP